MKNSSSNIRTFSLHAHRRPLPKGARVVHDLQDNCHGQYAVLIEHDEDERLKGFAERCYDRALIAPGMKLSPKTPSPRFDDLPKHIRANWLLLAHIFEEEYGK